MCDLIVTSSAAVFEADTGEINECDKIVIENQKQKEKIWKTKKMICE